MERSSLEAPDVSLDRTQRVRFVLVAMLVAFLVMRTVPDLVRLWMPLNVFGYVTDPANAVVWVDGSQAAGRSDQIEIGDRVRIDRISPFDRKPGLAGAGYSRDTPDRKLPVQRGATVRDLHLAGKPEPLASRASALIRVLFFLASLALGAIIFLVRPSVATGAIFCYCVSAQAPATFSEVVLDNPWRQIPIWVADVIHGAGRPALLAFSICLLSPGPRIERLAATGLGVLAFVLGNLNAFADWSQTYGGTARPELAEGYVHASSALTLAAIAAFALALLRASGAERRRIGWIAMAFALTGVARIASDAFFPAHIAPWANGLLLSATIVPIGVVWYSVLRHGAFDVDFVVGRAIVYVAVTGAVVGSITLAEEIGTYVFYQNTDLAYGFLIVISTLVGMATGKIREAVETLVDRFVFRNRHERRQALDFIAGYVLDAEHPDDVYRALLDDTTHALSIDFAGVLVRGADDAFVLERSCNWPADLHVRIDASEAFVREIRRSRATLEFSGKRRSDVAATVSPRLSLVAPLLSGRGVVALIAYGRNVSGLNLNSDERERLTRLVAHASLAIAELEFARKSAAVSPAPLV